MRTKIRLFVYLLISGLFLCLPNLIYSDSSAPTLTSPVDKSMVTTIKPTFTWSKITGTAFYELQICKDTSFKTGLLKINVKDTNATYTPTTAFYLAYNQNYFWRVRVGSTTTTFSDVFSFSTGNPSNDIGIDANASIVFDHTTGSISQITFINGSNKQLLNVSSNTKNKFGLGRVVNETGTKLVSWTESPGNYIYTYENSMYDTKVINITWSASGISVQMAFNLAASKSITLNTSLQPGGDIGPLHDYLLYKDSTGSANRMLLTYPSTNLQVYKGQSNFLCFNDDRYDEFFGYYFPVKTSVSLQQGVLFGPVISNTVVSTTSTFIVNFAIEKKTDFFSLVNQKAIIVSTPSASSKFIKNSTQVINWKTFGISGNLDVLLSTNAGKTYSSLLSNITDDDSASVQLSTISDSCYIKVSGTGVAGISGMFKVADTTYNKFSISKSITESPSDDVSIPIIYSPGTLDTLAAFDVRLNYDPSILTFKSFIFDSYFRTKTGVNLNWSTDATNNAASGFIQIGAFKVDTTLKGLSTGDTIGVAKFTIKSTARVGTTTKLNIDNKYLSATNNKVKSMNSIGSDGQITLYSRITGNIRYFNTKTPIYADSLINLIFLNTNPIDTLKGNATITGSYNYVNVLPGDSVRISLNTKKNYPDKKIINYVNSADARLAFDGRDGGTKVLTELQKISADINRDGIINSFDAFAILQISTGAKTVADFGLDKWVFVDSSFVLNATNWPKAATSKLYAPLDSIKTKQSFWAIIRGDIDGSYNTSVKFSKTSSTEQITDSKANIEFTVSKNIKAQPGDTVLIPLNVNLHGQTLGSFNSSIQIDKAKLTYTGKYNGGTAVPWDAGWVVSTNYDKNGVLNVGATDLSGALDPITKDGTLIVFKYVVNSQLLYGDTSQVGISDIYASDSKLVKVNVVPQNGKVLISNITSVGQENNIPKEYSLSQNYPNPFNPSTLIEYGLKKDGKVTVEIYNILGEQVTSLVNGYQAAGKYKIVWNASRFSSGIYFYRIKSGDFNQIKKMVLIK